MAPYGDSIAINTIEPSNIKILGSKKVHNDSVRDGLLGNNFTTS
jgi:hypothetical protein